MKKIVFATKNRGKAKEFKDLIKKHRLAIEVLTLHDFDDAPKIEESGSTFKENALIKARETYKKFGIPAIADDSGIIAEALKNEPGVKSARYAGDNATDEMNNRKLIEKLKGKENRNAYFKCVLCYYKDDDNIFFTEGECHGVIIDTPRGDKGFGYDPIFFIPELGKTMAELDMTVKNRISHRAKAFEKMIEILKND